MVRLIWQLKAGLLQINYDDNKTCVNYAVKNTHTITMLKVQNSANCLMSMSSPA